MMEEVPHKLNGWLEAYSDQCDRVLRSGGLIISFNSTHEYVG